MRPLPSDSTTPTVPVSAMPKFAPETPTRAREELRAQVAPRRLGERLGIVAERLEPELVRSNRSRISARLRWIAGTRMCDDQSCASWTISSARSVSIAVTPRGSSACVEVDLVRRQRLDLDHLARAVRLRDRRQRSRWPRSPSRAQCTWPPAGLHRRLELLEQRRRAGAWRRALIASPAARSSSQSGTSATTASRLARIVARGLCQVAAQLRFAQRLAQRREASCPGPPGSRPGAGCARRSRRAPQPAADVHQARAVGRRAHLARACREHAAQLVGEHRQSTRRRS